MSTVPSDSFWLATNTGKIINLEKPDPSQITIGDIAFGLSKICRFNGQLDQWYSVAEHSIHVAELVPTELKLQALLHDATEAYICDIPTPLKRYLGSVYTELEARLALCIGKALKVDLCNLHPTVIQADRMMVVTERDALQRNPMVGSWSPAYENSLRYPGFSMKHATPYSAEIAFLEAYRRYTN